MYEANKTMGYPPSADGRAAAIDRDRPPPQAADGALGELTQRLLGVVGRLENVTVSVTTFNDRCQGPVPSSSDRDSDPELPHNCALACLQSAIIMAERHLDRLAYETSRLPNIA